MWKEIILILVIVFLWIIMFISIFSMDRTLLNIEESQVSFGPASSIKSLLDYQFSKDNLPSNIFSKMFTDADTQTSLKQSDKS